MDDPRFPRPHGMSDEEYSAARRANRIFAEQLVADARKKLGIPTPAKSDGKEESDV